MTKISRIEAEVGRQLRNILIPESVDIVGATHDDGPFVALVFTVKGQPVTIPLSLSDCKATASALLEMHEHQLKGVQ